ncbi:unnamed protein product [Mytilus edulis]|uniref:Uncharacterized protein n=1 Tax=Mytilus edulis TaxID=6550 RepID=A0A8S3R898_MYTED|nr:unnamed protein product [Mytilus edulis]
MRQASKEHKITLNKAFANYQQRAADELRNISKKDTKALWKILNNLNDSKKKDNNDDISLKALYDHFKILNETVETENDFEQDLEFDTLSDDVELFLNSPVTEDEIKKVVSNLKNGKASGTIVLHLGLNQLDLGAVELDLDTIEFHLDTIELHLGTIELHLGTIELHLGTIVLHLGIIELDLGVIELDLGAN